MEDSELPLTARNYKVIIKLNIITVIDFVFDFDFDYLTSKAVTNPEPLNKVNIHIINGNVET